MKKIKYLLALCLSIVCIGAVSVSAATIDTTMAEEIALFENLGFTLPEKSTETDLVTRGEFLGTLTQFFNREFAAGGEYSFADVPKDDNFSGALNYAVAMGIVSDGEMFYPQDNVTYKQAMKMAVAFLGRGLEAEAAGGYDGGGYNAVASNLKLFSGLKDMSGENVTLRDFYKILYNVGQANMYVRDIYNNIYTGNTPFVEFFNMYQIRGIVTMNEDTGLKDNYVNSPEGTVAINSDLYRYDGNAPLGYNVTGWARNVQGDMREILMIKEYRNESEEINLIDIEGRVENNYFYYDVNGKDEKLKIKDPVIIYNDIAAPTMKVTDIFKCKLGTATFIDNDADGYYNVIKVEEYRPVIVSVTSAMRMRINDKNGAAYVNLNDDTCKEYTIIKAGQEIDIKDLAKDNFLMVYESKKSSHVRIEVLDNTVSGVVKTINTTGRKIRIDDNIYVMGDYFNKYYASKIVPGSTINVHVTPDGVVQALSEKIPSTTKYGYIVRMWQDVATDKYHVEMINENCEVITVTLAKSVTFDNVSGMKGSEVENELRNLAGISDSDKTWEDVKIGDKPKLFVKYALNEEGTELKIIDSYTPLTKREDPQNYLTGKEEPNNNMTEWNFPTKATDNPFFNRNIGAWGNFARTGGSTKFFVLDPEATDAEKMMRTISKEEFADKNYKRKSNDFGNREYRVFNVNHFGVVEAVLVCKGITPSVSSGDPRGLVWRVSTAANSNGDRTQEVVIYRNGKYETYLMSVECRGIDMTTIESSDSAQMYYELAGNTNKNVYTPMVGDYIGYALNTKNEILAVKPCYSESAAKAYGLSSPSAFHETSTHMYVSGKVYDIDGTYISIIPSGADFVTDAVNFDIKKHELISFEIGTAPIDIVMNHGKSLLAGSMGDIDSYMTVGKDADDVIVHFYAGNPVEIILYK